MFHQLYTSQAEALEKTPWDICPRPQMRRESYFCLNGLWELSVEDEINGFLTYDRKVCKADEKEMTALAKKLQAQLARKKEETVKICLKYGCSCDIVLMDISTVSKRPQNLILWARVVMYSVKYYGE